MNKLKQLFTSENVSTLFNLSGTILIVVGLSLLPIHLSYRLIFLGTFGIIMWYTLSK